MRGGEKKTMIDSDIIYLLPFAYAFSFFTIPLFLDKMLVDSITYSINTRITSMHSRIPEANIGQKSAQTRLFLITEKYQFFY